MILGLDPGKAGALAIIDELDTGRVPVVMDMRYLGDIPDVGWLDDQVFDTGVRPVLVVVENQQPMPKQGLVSTYQNGVGYGALLAWATLLQVPFITPRPSVWKRKMGVSRDKAECVALAAQLFPGAGLHGPRGGAKDGRAESLLLAEYGRRFHLGLVK